jgi:hypothetical protein
MNHAARCSVALAALLTLLAAPAHADAPLRTDNAEVPDQGNCKLEAAYVGRRSLPGYFIEAACVPFGIVEFAAALDRDRDAEGRWTSQIGLQAKVPLVPKDDDDDVFALATTVSIVRTVGEPHGASAFQQLWLNVPASFYLMDDRLRFHLDAGTIWQYAAGNVFTWGVAAEFEKGSLTWLAETYHLENGRPRYNIGARYALAPGTDLYLSAGRRFGSDPEGWLWTAGIKLESPSFLK